MLPLARVLFFIVAVAAPIFAVKELHGYIEVNKQYDANLFYWLFESQSNPETAPLVMWLTGGPGCSSEVAIFFENGPYKIDPSTLKLSENPFSWNKIANVLYVDNPVGTGFSYTNEDYIHNSTMVANELYIFIQAFLEMYPQYQKRDFFVTGESYAGHYIPAFGAKVLDENEAGNNPKINLRGLAIGDGLVDIYPTAESWGPFLYEHQLISKPELDDVQQQFFESCKPALDKGDWQTAFYECNEVLGTALQYAGNINVYDIRKPCNVHPLCYDLSYIGRYLNQDSVRKQLGVGNRQWTSCNMQVYQPFESKDFDFSYRFDIPRVLKDIPVLIYNGDEDLIVDFYGTSQLLANMKWPGQVPFAAAKNVTWTVSNKVAGSARSYDHLTYLVVERAGHMVPHDQPKNALDMLEKFLYGKPFGA